MRIDDDNESDFFLNPVLTSIFLHFDLRYVACCSWIAFLKLYTKHTHTLLMFASNNRL